MAAIWALLALPGFWPGGMAKGEPLVAIPPIAAASMAWGKAAPAPNATLAGSVPLAVNPPAGMKIVRVDYRLNGRVIASAEAPFEVRWQSESAWDGAGTLQAVALDAEGRILAKSPPRPVTVGNTEYTVRLLSPEPGRPISGTVPWRVALERRPAEGAMPGKPLDPASALYFLVDGKPLMVKHDAVTAELPLETTRLGNGMHELAAVAFTGADVDHLAPVAASQVRVKVENGQAVRGIRSRFSDLFLTPGQSAQLAPLLLHTDGTTKPLDAGVSFASDNPAVASVDDAGNVRYAAPGLATITLSARGYSATARVTCALAQGVVHFSADGQVLKAYDPKRSMFVRTLFNLGPGEIAQTPELAQAAHAAGINTLTSGFYSNPADNPADDFAQWKRQWLKDWQQIERAAADNHFSLLLQGDDLARTHGELLNSIQNPWSAEAIQFALSKARDSGRVVCIEMIDEINGMYGDTPTPKDGRWKNPPPGVGDDAFERLMKILDAVRDRPRISWPASAIASEAAVRNWNDPRFSDYVSHYWDTRDFFRAHAQGTSLAQEAAAMNQTVHQRAPLVPAGRPQLMEVSLTGPFYVKQGPGNAYVPGQDRLIDPGADPQRVSSQIMRAVALGAAGIRAYGFDGAWGAERQHAPAGQTLQTGANPLTGVGAGRWRAMSRAFNLIQALQPQFLAARIDAEDLGPDLTTAARQAPESRLFMAVSDTDAEQTVTIDLRPYRYPKGSITRYTLDGAALQRDTFGSADSLKQTFSPGSTVIYVFTPPNPAK